jgi:hypothetical protein
VEQVLQDLEVGLIMMGQMVLIHPLLFLQAPLLLKKAVLVHHRIVKVEMEVLGEARAANPHQTTQDPLEQQIKDLVADLVKIRKDLVEQAGAERPKLVAMEITEATLLEMAEMDLQTYYAQAQTKLVREVERAELQILLVLLLERAERAEAATEVKTRLDKTQQPTQVQAVAEADLGLQVCLTQITLAATVQMAS